MSILEQLGVALGLATLAGVNLYLTVFLTGIAIRFDLLHLADKYQTLEVLSHPAVLAVAGVLFIMEFLADKVPWLDTLWDSVHTFIRPIGGTLLGLQALGEMPTYMQVVAGLIAGGAALTTHGVKSGTRLMVNHSPEPVSNVSLSVTEDAAVAGGLALTLLHPVVALITFSSLLFICWLLLPRIWRGTKATIRLAWYKLQMPGKRQPLVSPVILPRRMNDTLRDMLLYRGNVADEEVQATVPCLTGKSKGVKGMSPNLNGMMVLTHSGEYLYFMASKGLRDRLFRIPLNGSTAQIESRFLSENLQIELPGMRAVFRFPRGEGDIAETIALKVNALKPQPEPEAAPEPVPSVPEPMPVPALDQKPSDSEPIEAKVELPPISAIDLKPGLEPKPEPELKKEIPAASVEPSKSPVIEAEIDVLPSVQGDKPIILKDTAASEIIPKKEEGERKESIAPLPAIS